MLRQLAAAPGLLALLHPIAICSQLKCPALSAVLPLEPRKALHLDPSKQPLLLPCFSISCPHPSHFCALVMLCHFLSSLSPFLQVSKPCCSFVSLWPCLRLLVTSGWSPHPLTSHDPLLFCLWATADFHWEEMRSEGALLPPFVDKQRHAATGSLHVTHGASWDGLFLECEPMPSVSLVGRGGGHPSFCLATSFLKGRPCWQN